MFEGGPHRLSRPRGNVLRSGADQDDRRRADSAARTRPAQYPPTAPRPPWTPCGPETPTTPASRSRTRSTARLLQTLDNLASGSPLQIFAELTLDVAFSIVVAPGTAAADVRTVAAFPVAAAQVRRWLAEHLAGAQVVPAISNAAAAQDVARRARRRGGQHRAGRAALRPCALADGVVDEPNARTRFVLVGRPAPPPARTGADRTSVVLRMGNAPGALVAALSEFGIRDIDLTLHRVPSHQGGAGHVRVLPGLRRPHRRHRGGRGTQSAAPTL